MNRNVCSNDHTISSNNSFPTSDNGPENMFLVSLLDKNGHHTNYISVESKGKNSSKSLSGRHTQSKNKEYS